MVCGRLFSTQLQERVELRLMKFMNYLQYTLLPIALRVTATSTQDSHGFLVVDNIGERHDQAGVIVCVAYSHLC